MGNHSEIYHYWHLNLCHVLCFNASELIGQRLCALFTVLYVRMLNKQPAFSFIWRCGGSVCYVALTEWTECVGICHFARIFFRQSKGNYINVYVNEIMIIWKERIRPHSLRISVKIYGSIGCVAATLMIWSAVKKQFISHTAAEGAQLPDSSICSFDQKLHALIK